MVRLMSLLINLALYTLYCTKWCSQPLPGGPDALMPPHRHRRTPAPRHAYATPLAPKCPAIGPLPLPQAPDATYAVTWWHSITPLGHGLQSPTLPIPSSVPSITPVPPCMQMIPRTQKTSRWRESDSVPSLRCLRELRSHDYKYHSRARYRSHSVSISLSFSRLSLRTQRIKKNELPYGLKSV